ncbi:UbiX family flavin prenyltransferase [Pollutimonas thiosulfatoxidans]|uniref:Flavin prenyltransferase UbiX n=1 Tax=Pollutimonas thiosulfatoxidans TaxID=2028345 RepID=A0A410GDJ6_9BURK|nr:UbiX family flavin prenyltransferase [Pollutimonas thiosulfatoxidans]MBF6617526.1 UbiX family flavin prenyltransferase [Candidimonas sp.]NYT44132.1 UbiX family flavin prenyltransferase [Alcaligenaceae bacterium]QAA94377.1 3-octaprenyl-4-hydroxybenzoate carboxy-lyase [Pollutimonas thiosulfatoxidans]
MTAKRRLVVGITGATGAVYAVRLLQAVRGVPDVESHLVVSPAGVLNIKYELDLTRQDVHALADQVYSFRDVGATLSSGGFATTGMVVVPCSMRTLAAVAHGFSDNLITRAADVTLKERRRLIMMVRETPLNLAHLRNMTAVTEMGGIIFPPLPAFYHHPKTLDEMVDHTVARVLELLDIHVPGPHWEGID